MEHLVWHFGSAIGLVYYRILQAACDYWSTWPAFRQHHTWQASHLYHVMVQCNSTMSCLITSAAVNHEHLLALLLSYRETKMSW